MTRIFSPSMKAVLQEVANITAERKTSRNFPRSVDSEMATMRLDDEEACCSPSRIAMAFADRYTWLIKY